MVFTNTFTKCLYAVDGITCDQGIKAFDANLSNAFVHFSGGLIGNSKFFKRNNVSRHNGFIGSNTPFRYHTSTGDFDVVKKPSVDTIMCFSVPRIFDEMQNDSTVHYNFIKSLFTKTYFTGFAAPNLDFVPDAVAGAPVFPPGLLDFFGEGGGVGASKKPKSLAARAASASARVAFN